jgi:protein-serine/threonine kinase
MIGQGSVGRVYEVIKRDTKRTYAMKVLSKRLLVEENVVDNAFTERNVLVQSLSNPFIANLKFSFQTTNHLFLVMDYFPSGELYDFLERERCLSEKRCQFFAAEIVCAFDHIHNRNIVYRNLKPESILLDGQGHLALTDFGLCKQLNHDNDLIKEADIPKKSIPEYLAPEMVVGKPYGKAVDWWSLGILLYELLTGSPPFHSVNDEDLFKQILKTDVEFPEGGCVSEQGKSFITSLLERDPSQRLGSNGLGEVKNHPFFEGVNWEVVYKKQMQLPFVAEVEEQFHDEAVAAVTARSIDIPNVKKTSATTNMTPGSFVGSTPVSDQPAFKGFSYIAEDTFVKKGEHILGINPEDEDPEIDFWFRK